LSLIDPLTLPRTEAEALDFARLTDLPALHRFVAALADASPDVEVRSVGKSMEGRELPLLRVRRGPGPRLGVFVLARQHGNEAAGTEAALLLARDLALGPLRSLLSTLELTLLPVVNPDGAARDTREAASGENLNRGHSRLTAPELRAVYRAFHEGRPHLTVDLHEYGQEREPWLAHGLRPNGDLLVDAATNLNVPAPLRHDLPAALLPEIARVLGRAGFRYGRYLLGGPPGVNPLRTSTLRANDGRNGLAVYGCLSFIFESGQIVGAPLGKLERRVRAHYLALKALLEGAAARAEAIVREVAKARGAAPDAPLHLWSRYEAAPCRESVHVLRLPDGRPERLPLETLYSRAVPMHTVPRPAAYLLPPGLEALTAALEAQGARLEPVTHPYRAPLTRYRVRDYTLAQESGTDQIPPEILPERVEEEVPAGFLRLPREGFSFTKAALLLEPGSVDGALVNGLLAPREDGRWPVVREEAGA